MKVNQSEYKNLKFAYKMLDLNLFLAVVPKEELCEEDKKMAQPLIAELIQRLQKLQIPQDILDSELVK